MASVRTARVAILVCLAALAFPAGAGAVRCAPPGNSEVDQYYETIPGSSCNEAPPGSAGPGGVHGGSSGSLSPASSGQLAAQGDGGRAVQRFVLATAPPIAASVPSRPTGAGGPTGAARSRPRGSTAAARALAPAASGQSPISGLLKPIMSGSNPSGSGPLLPILFGAALLLAIVVVLRRLWLRR
jgi:hypothetical protein